MNNQLRHFDQMLTHISIPNLVKGFTIYIRMEAK